MSASEEIRRSASPQSDRSTSPDAEGMNWAHEATKAAEKDSRVQPWKQTYRGLVDNSLDAGPDYMTVTSQGGKNVGSRQGKDTSLAA